MAASVLRVQPQVAQDHAPGGTLISKNPVATTRWIEALMENSSMVRLRRTPSMEMNRRAPRGAGNRCDSSQARRGGPRAGCARSNCVPGAAAANSAIACEVIADESRKAGTSEIGAAPGTAPNGQNSTWEWPSG